MITNILTLTPGNTPVKLKQIKDPPSQLFARGDVGLLSKKPAIAVVGARKISAYGKQVTADLVSGLCRAGFVIISGLAFGVDALAHRTALDCGGKTIAVLPSPVDKIYPASNYRLSEQIAEKGLLLSEYPSGMVPQKFFFAQRNRIVSGLSDGVLIIQAAENSGTLITANLAKQQGRKLFVVPGEITSSAFAGNNQLIREGATLVRSANDIILDFGLEQLQLTNPQSSNPILQLIKDGAVESSEIQKELRMSAQEFNQQVSILEIEGYVKPKGDNTWILT
ncbi:MAG: DNA-processing protein DprA [bacterium]|nr:DNA-processing protein DprA [bacterium]